MMTRLLFFEQTKVVETTTNACDFDWLRTASYKRAFVREPVMYLRCLVINSTIYDKAHPRVGRIKSDTWKTSTYACTIGSQVQDVYFEFLISYPVFLDVSGFSAPAPVLYIVPKSLCNPFAFAFAFVFDAGPIKGPFHALEHRKSMCSAVQPFKS